MSGSTNVIGGILEELGEQGKKVAKETGKQLVGSLNILEGLDPVNPAEVADKSKQYENEKKAKLAKVRSGLSVLQESPSKPQEDRRVDQGETKAEKGQANQNAQMNNPLSANMKPQKKLEPLVVQQKRNNKLHGAG